MRWSIIALVVLAFSANATERNNDRDNRADADARAEAGAHAGAAAGANSESNATGIRGDVTAGGGDASAISEGSTATVGDVAGGSASNEGVNVGGDTISNESNFFAFSTGFPQASGCFGGAQGGGAGGSGGGFLGIHILNHDCWTSSLAEAEANVELRALLKCGGKKFRNAVAFDQPSRQRQRYCVDYVSDIYMQEIAVAAARVEAAIETEEIVVTTGDPNVAYEQMMAQVSEEEFAEHNEEVEEEIDALRRRAEAAERRAREAEQRVEDIEQRELTKEELLRALQQEVQEDYERIKPKEK